MKKHDVNYHDHDYLILFHFNHYIYFEAFEYSFSNQSTKKKVFFQKETSLINQKSSGTKK
jgi:hypothetical protein